MQTIKNRSHSSSYSWDGEGMERISDHLRIEFMLGQFESDKMSHVVVRPGPVGSKIIYEGFWYNYDSDALEITPIIAR